MIQNLQLHTYISCISLGRGTNTQTIVGSRSQFEFKTENKVLILVACIKVSTIASLMRNQRNHTVVIHIITCIADPLVHIRTVKQHFKALFFLFRRQTERFYTRQLVDVQITEIYT